MNNMEPLPITKKENKEVVDKEKNLILYNDNINTFEHVIKSLIKICRHDSEQAEQCAFIVHFNGKCAVKKGSFKKLKPIAEALSLQGLTVEIE